jgi:Uma2 family endonuclease
MPQLGDKTGDFTMPNPKIPSLPTDRDFYPSSDGKPMAETDIHRDLMVEFIDMLRHHYRARSDVYVSGNLLLYYEQGNRKKSISPDVFVTFGIENKKRETYLLWEEGKGPDFVLELSSKNTYRHDLNLKKKRYASILEVEDYFLYDPNHQYLQPALQGFRRVDGVYVPIQPVAERLPSTVLGLELGLKPDGELGLYDPQTDRWLLLPEERVEQAQVIAERAQTIAERAQTIAEQAQTDAERAQTDAERAQTDAEQAQASAEQARDAAQQAAEYRRQEAVARRQAEARAQQAEARAQQAEARAQQEAEARQQAEAELARLRAEFARRDSAN